MRWSRLWTAERGRRFTCLALSALLCCGAVQAEDVTLRSTPSDKPVIRLGAAVSLSGRYAQGGRYLRDGYQLAIELINARGGVVVAGEPRQLQLTYLDDMSEASLATAIVEKMVSEDGVQLLLGPYSTQLAQAVEPIAERHKVPLVEAGAAGRSLFERGYDYLFGLLTTTDYYMDDIFRIAEEEAAPKLGKEPEELSVGLVVLDDRFSQDLREEVLSEIDEHNMRLVIDDRLSKDSLDMSMTVERVMLLRPDIMVISGHERAALAALEHLHQRRAAIPMLTITHCRPANMLKLKPEASEGVFCPMQWHPSVPYRDDTFGSARDYEAKFRQRHGYAPPYQAAQASAAVLVYAKAIEQSGSTDPAIVRKALAELDIDTFYGPIDFHTDGRNTAKPLLLMQVIDGQYMMIAPRHLSRAEPVIVVPPTR